MRLHSFAPSPNHRKVAATAAHLGLPLEDVTVDLGQGDNQKPEFLAMNPNGMIPMLEDGDFHLSESSAIMIYLCSKKPGQTLLPSDPRQHADVMRWMFWQAHHWGRACGMLLYERLVKKMLMGQEPDPAVEAQGEEMFHRFARVLDAHLANRQWLVGDSVTLADFANGAMFMYHQVARLPAEDYKNIHAWYQRLEGLEAWQKTAPPMPAARA